MRNWIIFFPSHYCHVSYLNTRLLSDENIVKRISWHNGLLLRTDDIDKYKLLCYTLALKHVHVEECSAVQILTLGILKIFSNINSSEQHHANIMVR